MPEKPRRPLPIHSFIERLPGWSLPSAIPRRGQTALPLRGIGNALRQLHSGGSVRRTMLEGML